MKHVIRWVLAASCVATVGLPTKNVAAAEMGWFGIGVRLGYATPSLKAGDVPLVGKKLSDALTNANKMVDAYNAAQGTNRPHYAMDDLNLTARAVQITPSLHLGGDGMFFKLEAPIGVSSELKTYGLGIYPINIAIGIPGIDLYPYISAGGVGTWATSTSFTPTGGQKLVVDAKGLILEARVAVGAKLYLVPMVPLSVEVGYSPYAAGGVVDTTRLNALKPPSGTPTAAPKLPDSPGAAVRGGVGHMLNMMVGIDFQ